MDQKYNKKIMSDMVAAKSVRVLPLPRGGGAMASSAGGVSDEVSHPPVSPRKASASQPPLAGGQPEQSRSWSGRIIPEYRMPEIQTPRSGGCLMWVIAAICIIALGLGIGGLFAHATIEVTPKTFSGDINTTISFSQNDESNSVFFATATKTFTDEIIVPATGTVSTESKATGKVRIYNMNAASKSILAGTKITSSKSIEYQIVKSVVVPAKKGATPGQIDANIVAVSIGADANTDPDDFTFMDTKKFAGITAKSFAAISGGASGNDSIADPAAVTEATEVLRTRFGDPVVLTKRIGETVPDNFIILPIQIASSAPSITTETKHSDGVHVVARQTVGVIMVRRDDIARAIGDKLNAGKDIPLSIDTFEGLSFITSTAMSASSIPAQFSARVTGAATVFGAADLEYLKNQIAGKSRSEAKKIMGAQLGIASYKLKIAPFWRRLVPVSLNDISIK